MEAYLFLCVMFMKIGVFGFGGGLAMLPMIFQTVQEAGFMSAAEFSNLVALSQVTPGPIAVNAATYVGFQYGGVAGAAAATFGVALPSFVIVLTVSAFLKKFHESRTVQGIFVGIRPVTVGLVASAVIVVGKTVLWTDGALHAVPLVIFALSFLLAAKFRISPIKITILMGLVGAWICS